MTKLTILIVVLFGLALGYLSSKKQKVEIPKVPLPEPGRGIMTLLLSENEEQIGEWEADNKIYKELNADVETIKANTVDELINNISTKKPAIVHLVTKVTSEGQLTDKAANKLSLQKLMTTAEQSGTQLLIFASETKPDLLSGKIPKDLRSLNYMIIIERNKHYPTFLKGIMTQLPTKSFAMAYVELAPQHESAQQGKPLPASLAVCPRQDAKSIVLWTEAQP